MESEERPWLNEFAAVLSITAGEEALARKGRTRKTVNNDQRMAALNEAGISSIFGGL